MSYRLTGVEKGDALTRGPLYLDEEFGHSIGRKLTAVECGELQLATERAQLEAEFQLLCRLMDKGQREAWLYIVKQYEERSGER